MLISQAQQETVLYFKICLRNSSFSIYYNLVNNNIKPILNCKKYFQNFQNFYFYSRKIENMQILFKGIYAKI